MQRSHVARPQLKRAMSGRISWGDGFIAVDWGTTNRRAYVVGADGRCGGEFEDDQGILAVPGAAFEPALAQIRRRFGDRPMLLAGMIGSNRGWIEAPYVACPAGLDELAGNLAWAPDGRAAIVPGVSYRGKRCDVMRGEEVQVLGAAEAGQIPADCLVCHPGTHNKWIEIDGGAITSFRTVMTGEMFNLLRDRSILSDLLDRPAETGEGFGEGVERGLSGSGLTSELFEVRARYLLGRLPAGDGSSFVSGLLIGEDIRVGLGGNRDKSVFVMGRPQLTGLYTAALGLAGVQCTQVDGEGAFIAGAKKIVERLQ